MAEDILKNNTQLNNECDTVLTQTDSVTSDCIPILKVIGAKKNFGSLEVLKGVDFEIKKGEVISIIGSSGGGKSTLLRCLVFLEKLTDGKIIIDGQTVIDSVDGKSVYPKEEFLKPYAIKLGLVFQDFNLFPHLNVLNNLTLALKLVKHMTKDDADIMAMDYLERVGLAEKAKSYPNELSGGQKQRVAIARALCLEPQILCFDEPTSALDPELTGEVLRVIKSLKDTGVTMLIVTHEIMFAREVADRIIFMDKGVILEEGNAKEVVDHPKNDRTREFMNQITSKM